MASTAIIDGFPRVGLTPSVLVTLDPGDAVTGCRWFWHSNPDADTALWTALGPETPALAIYLIAPEDEFTHLRARIKFANSPTVWTLPIGPVTSEISYAIAGIAVMPGTVLFAHAFNADGDKAQSYEWYRRLPTVESWTKINGATLARYAIQAGDIGYIIRPSVKFKQAGTLPAPNEFGPVTRG